MKTFNSTSKARVKINYGERAHITQRTNITVYDTNNTHTYRNRRGPKTGPIHKNSKTKCVPCKKEAPLTREIIKTQNYVQIKIQTKRGCENALNINQQFGEYEWYCGKSNRTKSTKNDK